MTTFKAAGSTDPGQVRSQNQDAFVASEALVLIADGMGGYAGGEVAAAIAAEVVEAEFGVDRTARGLGAAVLDANRRIFERGGEPGLAGMGTTLVAVAVIAAGGSERLLLANVGDSRCYLLRDGNLRQLTEDHSVAAELVRLGRIDDAEEAEHPGRHVLTRALGVDHDVEPDMIEMEPRADDRLLLCSDGLSNELSLEDMRGLLAVGEPSDAARALVAAANAHGGVDNITAVVADVLEAPALPPDATGVVAVAAGPAALEPLPRPSMWDRRRRRRQERRERRTWNKWVSLRGAVFVIAFAAVLVGAWFVLRWYATSSYYVTEKDGHVVIYQGRPGGFWRWKPVLVTVEPYKASEIPPADVPMLKGNVIEATRADATSYAKNLHVMWMAQTGATTTTTTTTTTYPAYGYPTTTSSYATTTTVATTTTTTKVG
jgi:protein phosphatase